jgi:hypothetical protein
LCETLTALGYTQTPITLEKLQEEFDRKVAFGLYSMIGPFAVMQSNPECGFNLDDVLDTGSNPGPSMYSEKYKAAVKWLLPILERKGAFDSRY